MNALKVITYFRDVGSKRAGFLLALVYSAMRSLSFDELRTAGLKLEEQNRGLLVLGSLLNGKLYQSALGWAWPLSSKKKDEGDGDYREVNG